MKKKFLEADVNKKDTSIELLRVFAMIMIVGYHVFVIV